MTTRSSSPWPSHYTDYVMPALTSTCKISVMPFTYNKKKVKVKWSRYRPGLAQKMGGGIAHYSSITAANEGRDCSAVRPDRNLHPGNSRYPLYRRLGGLQGQSRQVENLVPTGIRSRTVQPAVSRYSDWTTRPLSLMLTKINVR